MKLYRERERELTMRRNTMPLLAISATWGDIICCLSSKTISIKTQGMLVTERAYVYKTPVPPHEKNSQARVCLHDDMREEVDRGNEFVVFDVQKNKDGIELDCQVAGQGPLCEQIVTIRPC